MKEQLRKAIKEQNSTLSAEYKERASRSITERVTASKQFENAETVFVYASTENEPSTNEIIDFALKNGKTVLVPKVTGKRKMIAVKTESRADLKKGYMGIPEPESDEEFKGKIDLSVIPCLGASVDGKRLGHGGGYYDTFLENRETYKMCLCFSVNLRDDIPTEKYDILMNGVVSEMLLIAHRSGPVIYPEQTVKSALHALSIGADMIEIDLRFNKDGSIIVSHDDNTERVFGVSRKTAELSDSEFAALRHSGNPEYGSHFFSDYVDAGVKPLLLHIKEGGERVFGIIDYLKKENYLENVVFGFSDPADVLAVKKYDPSIPVLAFIKNPDYIDANIDAGADYIRLWQGNTTEERINYITSKGKKVWIMLGHAEGYEVGYTSREFYNWLLTQKVDGVLINDVNFVLRPEE